MIRHRLLLAAMMPCLTAGCMGFGVAAGPPQVTTGLAVDFRAFANPASPTGGLQEAIDSLGPDGGIVTIPPCVIVLRRSVVLRSRVTLRGSGPATVIRRDPGCFSPLAADCPVGATEVEVRDAQGFAPGQEVAIRDTDQNGWGILHAIVMEVRGNRIVLDRPTKEDYKVAREAAAIHSFPALHAFEQTMIAIEDLTIDGDAARQPAKAPGDFTMAAVHLHRTTVARVHNVTVLGWPSDGIGVQGGGDVQVTDCTAIACRGHGFHPGTSINGAVWTGNIGRDNTRDGLYFCAGIRHITVSNNVFRGNGRDGIGGVGDANDQWNVVSANVCAENGRSGIWVADGKNNVVTGNVCVNNSRNQPGRYAGIAVVNTTGSLITGNRVSDDQKEPTQRIGIAESGKSDQNLISGNHVSGSEKGIVKVGEKTQVVGNLE